MLRLLPIIILLSGCVTAQKEPQPSDTAFDESKRDWLEVYRAEIKAAVENQDKGAYDFFFEEYMKERIRQYKEEQKNAK